MDLVHLFVEQSLMPLGSLTSSKAAQGSCDKECGCLGARPYWLPYCPSPVPSPAHSHISTQKTPCVEGKTGQMSSPTVQYLIINTNVRLVNKYYFAWAISFHQHPVIMMRIVSLRIYATYSAFPVPLNCCGV